MCSSFVILYKSGTILVIIRGSRSVAVLKGFKNSKIPALLSNKLVWPLLFALVALGAVVFIQAATPTSSFESESGTVTNGAQIVSDGNASGGSAIKFTQATQLPVTTLITATGAPLPAGEGSGLVASRQYPGVFWWIRDGGEATAGKPRDAAYALKYDPNGNLVNVRGTDKFPYNMVTEIGRAHV